jgi:hypothetical protein
VVLALCEIRLDGRILAGAFAFDCVDVSGCMTLDPSMKDVIVNTMKGERR